MCKNNHPPTWVSQNFLTGTKIIRRLVRKTSINTNDHVIEIGPGKGHITGVLLRHSKKVSAIEIDRNLYNKLCVKYDGAGLIRVFTKKQLSRACREAGLSDLVSGEILYIQWLCLFRCYCFYVKKGCR